MTHSDLDEIRKRCEAATEGPWEVECDERSRLDGTPRVDGIYGPPRTVDYGMGPERWHPRIVETDSGVYEPKWNDATFIAHARTDVPRLLDEVERLRGENKWLQRENNIHRALAKRADSIRRVLVTIDEFDMSDAERRQRLALLEPVWEACKGVHRVMPSAADARRAGAANALCELIAAIDAAVAKEGK